MQAHTQMRAALRAMVMEQAVENGFSVRDAIALVDQLHTAGTLNTQADQLAAEMELAITEAVRLLAQAILLVNQAKRDAGLHITPALRN